MSGANLRVLIVDDEDDMRLLLRNVLTADRGFEIVGEAVDGETAIRAAADLKPDAIVLDHRMPDLTGVDAAQSILADRPDTVIVLFSAHLDADIRSDAATAGIRECVSKANLFDLPARLAQLLGAA
jgi:DNA-binding NarL/FixJ family response regulator